jgi:hypothetical protein
MDILKFVASAMDIFLAVSCKYCGCNWAGPDDLVTFSFSGCFCAVFGLNLIVDSFSSVLWSSVGALRLSTSTVKTFWKYVH